VIKETFSVEGPTEIEISASSGSVAVESGPPGSVEIEVDTPNPDGWRVIQSGASISIRYERGFIDRGGRARVRVVAPDRSSLDVHTASADVRAVLSLERVSVATASGDVRLGDVGTAAIKTASGDITVGEAERDLAARSASGDVMVGTVGGRAGLTTVSGDLLIERVAGHLTASTASGDLRVGRYLGEDLEASTVSGDVFVGLPSGRIVKLEAKTLSGSVHLPDRKQSGGSTGPGVSLRLKSVSGDITIRRAE
jgi:DUF4097 and DUF4098 domain-containing protein YvlB